MKVDAEMLVSSLGKRASEFFKQFMASAPFDGSAFNYDAPTAFGILQGYKAELAKLTAAGEQMMPILDFFGIEYLSNRDLEQMETDSGKLWEVWTLKVGSTAPLWVSCTTNPRCIQLASSFQSLWI